MSGGLAITVTAPQPCKLYTYHITRNPRNPRQSDASASMGIIFFNQQSRAYPRHPRTACSITKNSVTRFQLALGNF
jgi:hypothetical protein